MEQNNLDSMYAAYKLELEDVHTVTIPEIGFANYKFEEDVIYVQEVYVVPFHRGTKSAAKLTDLCITHAKHNSDIKIKNIYTTIGVKGNDTINSSIRAITDYGFKILKTDNELIYFYKELNNE